MTIKELAYFAQQHLQSSTGITVKRSHIYELLASVFGYHSYAALTVDAVLTRQRQWPDQAESAARNTQLKRRCSELGYKDNTAAIVTTALPAFFVERQIGIVKMTDLVRSLLNESQDCETQPHEEEEMCLLMLEGLEHAASNNIALAHYALALLHEPADSDEEQEVGSAYWHSQGKLGRVLVGVEQEWADRHAAYLVHQAKVEKYTHHLREAARLGNPRACLDYAEQFDEPAFLEQIRQSARTNLAVFAELSNLNREDDKWRWLTAAAEEGDTEAMRELIEDYDNHDLLRCWTWMYLAQLLGTDLTADRHEAISEDGSPYDDDAGGPLYADCHEGVRLAPPDEQQNTTARRAAAVIFQRIQRAV